MMGGVAGEDREAAPLLKPCLPARAGGGQARGLAWGNRRFPETDARPSRADHQTGGVRLVRIPPDGASPASAGISDPSFFSPKRCVRGPGGQLPTAAHSPALLDGASGSPLPGRVRPLDNGSRTRGRDRTPQRPRQARSGLGEGRTAAGTRARPGVPGTPSSTKLERVLAIGVPVPWNGRPSARELRRSGRSLRVQSPFWQSRCS